MVRRSDRDVVAHTVRSLRAARNLSQREVADRAGVAVNTYVRIERGEPGLDNCTREVANALGVSYGVLAEAMEEARRLRERN